MNFVLLAGKLNYVDKLKTVGDTYQCVGIVACNKIRNETVLTDFIPFIVFGECAIVLSKCKKGDYVCLRGYWKHTSVKFENGYRNKDQCCIEYVEVLQEAPKVEPPKNLINNEPVNPYEGFDQAFPPLPMDDDMLY